MSATAWIGASHVTRSATPSRIGIVSSVSAGPRSRPRGTPRAHGDTAPRSGGLSTTVPLYCPLRSIESTQPSSRSSSKIASVQSGRASSLKRRVGVDRQEGSESRRRRRVAEAPGGDERHGSGRASDDVAEASVPPDGARDRALRSRTPSDGSPRSRGGPGASGNSATVPRWREKLSIVHSPASGEHGSRVPAAPPGAPPSYVTSSPRPSSPAPDSRITVVLRSEVRARGVSCASSP